MIRRRSRYDRRLSRSRVLQTLISLIPAKCRSLDHIPAYNQPQIHWM